MQTIKINQIEFQSLYTEPLDFSKSVNERTIENKIQFFSKT